MATSTKTHVSRSSVLFFRLNFVPFVHPFWNSELFWQLRTAYDHKTKWKLHVAWKIYRTIGWLWHPEKGGQQILASKLRSIVTILPYGFIQSTAIAKKHPQKILETFNLNSQSAWKNMFFFIAEWFQVPAIYFEACTFLPVNWIPTEMYLITLKTILNFAKSKPAKLCGQQSKFCNLVEFGINISLNKLTLRIRSTPPGSNRNFRVPIPSEKNRNGSGQSQNLRTYLDS